MPDISNIFEEMVIRNASTSVLLDELLARIPEQERLVVDVNDLDSEIVVTYLILGMYIKWITQDVRENSDQTLVTGTDPNYSD